MYLLALCYVHGKGIGQDLEAAKALCQKALESEDIMNEQDEELEDKLKSLLDSLEQEK